MRSIASRRTHGACDGGMAPVRSAPCAIPAPNSPSPAICFDIGSHVGDRTGHFLAFTKIAVEGLESQVLAGLSRPLPALSPEYVTVALDGAFAVLDRLRALGSSTASAGESLRLLRAHRGCSGLARMG